MTFADFMHWIAIVRRHPLSAFCALICAVCVGICVYIHGNMAWLELEHKQVLQDGDLDLATMISGPSVKQERIAALEITHRLEDNLVIEDNLAENLWYFYRIEQKSKAHISELRPLNSVVTDSRTSYYRRVPFAVRVVGSYEETGAFLYAIETGPRISNITQLNFRRAEPGSTQTILEFNVELLGKR